MSGLISTLWTIGIGCLGAAILLYIHQLRVAQERARIWAQARYGRELNKLMIRGKNAR